MKKAKKEVVLEIKALMKEHNVAVFELIDYPERSPKQLIQVKCGYTKFEHDYVYIYPGGFICRACGKSCS